MAHSCSRTERDKAGSLRQRVTTIAKLVPIFLFILIAIIAFNWDKFTLNFWGKAIRRWEAISVRSSTKSKDDMVTLGCSSASKVPVSTQLAQLDTRM